MIDQWVLDAGAALAAAHDENGQPQTAHDPARFRRNAVLVVRSTTRQRYHAANLEPGDLVEIKLPRFIPAGFELVEAYMPEGRAA